MLGRTISENTLLLRRSTQRADAAPRCDVSFFACGIQPGGWEYSETISRLPRMRAILLRKRRGCSVLRPMKSRRAGFLDREWRIDLVVSAS